jgi:hypothetical protein
MGHALGGSGVSVMGVVRVRPPGWGLEPGLRVRSATWGMQKYTPGTGRQITVGFTVKNLPQGARGGPSPATSSPSTLRWEIIAEWNREKAEPGAYQEDPQTLASSEKDWWRVYFKVGL